MTRKSLPLALGFLWGLGIWITAPLLIGQTEPWDTGWPHYWLSYYRLVMGAGGFVIGLSTRSWGLRGLAFFATWAGQACGMFTRAHARELWLFGLGTAGIGTLLILPGLLLAGLLHAIVKRRRPHQSELSDKHTQPDG